MTTARPNPYVGPRSFKIGEHIYGRDQEALALLDLLIAERIVLLYSPSWAGKTSLIQAALIPQLIGEGFRVLPPMRVSLEPPQEIAVSRSSSLNRYVLSALLSLEEGLPEAQQMPLSILSSLSLADYLEQRPRQEDEPENLVLLFDQFEEILTIDAADQIGKAAFFAQVGAALRNRHIWALFAMREDHLAGLDPYLRPIPTRLSTTFRLDLLDEANARLAMQRPAAKCGGHFTDAAARKLADDLRKVRVQRPDGTTEEQLGLYIEPVQLQVVCYRLWSNLRPDDNVIDEDDIAAVGDVDSALAAYYAERVAGIAAQIGVGERAIREWCEHQLITDQGIRGQVLQGNRQTAGLANQAIGQLIDAHLVRAEKRRGATWFELAHDRLIEPIRKSNALWRDAHLSMLQQQSMLWESRGRSDDLLLRGQTLREAEEWASEHSDELTEVDQAFLAACRLAQKRARQERRKNRIIGALAVAAVIVMVVALYFYAQAQIARDAARKEAENARGAQATSEANAATARQAQATSEANAQQLRLASQEIERKSRLTLAQGLASAAIIQLDHDPELSLLLATEAVSSTYAVDGDFTSEAQAALLRAVDASRIQRVLRSSFPIITGVAFSPDGRRIATVTRERGGTIWDAETGQALLNLSSSGELNDISFSPDGARLVTAGSNGTAVIWDAGSGEQMITLSEHREAITTARFNADGTRLLTASKDRTAGIWDASSGRLLLRIRGHSAALRAAVFSPDGSQVATASDDGTARIWDAATGRERRVMTGGENLLELAFSPDGKYLAVAGSDKQVKLWELAFNRPPIPLSGHQGAVYAVVFDPAGSHIATSSRDGTVKVWSASDGRLLLTLLGHTNIVDSIAFSPDGLHLASAGWDGTVRIWNASTDHLGEVEAIAYSADGKYLVSASQDGTAKIWDAATHQLVLTIAHPNKPLMLAVAFSPDARLLAAADSNGVVKMWELPAGRELYTIASRNQRIFGLAFNPAGTILATAGMDGVVQLIDVSSGQQVGVLTAGRQGRGLSFSLSGDRLAVGGEDGMARIWDSTSGQLLLSLTGHEGTVYDVAFSPDGKLLATADVDGHINLWDAATGQEVRALTGHSNAVVDIAFSADGKQLVSAGWDSTARVWDLTTFTALTLNHNTQVNYVAVHPNGKWVATASNEPSIHFYPLTIDDLLALAHTRATRTLTDTERQQYGLLSTTSPTPSPTTP